MLTRTKAVDALNGKFDVLELLVSKLCLFVNRAHAAISRDHSVAGGIPPGQGSYTYYQIVEEYIRLISFLAECQTPYFPRALADRLWEALVLNSVAVQDQMLGVNFFLSGASETMLIELDTMKFLLVSRITKLPVGSLSTFAWNLFEEYFRRVSNCGMLVQI